MPHNEDGDAQVWKEFDGEKALRGILDKLVQRLEAVQKKEAPKRILDPAKPRTHTRGLELTIMLQTMDGGGNRVQGQWRLVRKDREEFDRIDHEMRTAIHEDLDRFLNDVNRLWDQMLNSSPEIDLGTAAFGGIPIPGSELEEGLPDERKLCTPISEPQADGSGD